MAYSKPLTITTIETPEAKMKAILRGVRAEADLTQAQLGTMIGRYFGIPAISQDTVSKWENNKCTLEIPSCYLGAVAEVCNVPAERMMV